MLSKKDIDRIATAVAEKLAPPSVRLNGPIAVKLTSMVEEYVTGMAAGRGKSLGQ